MVTLARAVLVEVHEKREWEMTFYCKRKKREVGGCGVCVCEEHVYMLMGVINRKHDLN